jgi:hypothetical protein
MDRLPDGPHCERGSDLIAFLHGEIDERAARDFEQHLKDCADCESELGAFKQIRSSVVAWRQESLGGATATSAAGSIPVGTVSGLRKPSAIAAIRAFFELSPLWMKGSIALASILFCLVSALALAHLFENSQSVVAGDEKRYTEKELQARVTDGVRSELQKRETEARPLASVANNSPQSERETRGTNRSRERVATGPKVRRGPLTKAEREQLAADLRLLIPQDDTDVDLLGDENNR